MTKKLQKPLDDPKTESSSNHDDVKSSGEEEKEVSSSSDDEKPTDAVTVPVPSKSSAAPTETDSDSGNAASAGALKEFHVVIALPALESLKKRKKIEEDTKKPAFQRVWSEEDEISVLQGMIDFKADTGKCLSEDTNGYYDFIKNLISFVVSKNQFMDKIRSLKKKYTGKENTYFTKPHDLKAFNLAKSVWGDEAMALESALRSSNTVSKKAKHVSLAVEDGERDLEKESEWFENSFIVKSIAGHGVHEKDVIKGWSLVEVKDKKKIEHDFKTLQAKEIENVLRKSKLVNEVMAMVAEASKNKSH